MFRCAIKIIDTIEVPQYVKFTSSKSHIEDSLEKFERDYGPQPECLKLEIEHSVINKKKCSSLKRVWEACPKLDLLFLGFVYAMHSMEIANKSRFGMKDCLTEGSFGWKCF